LRGLVPGESGLDGRGLPLTKSGPRFVPEIYCE